MLFAGFFFLLNLSSMCREVGKGKQNTLLHVQAERRFSFFFFFLIFSIIIGIEYVK